MLNTEQKQLLKTQGNFLAAATSEDENADLIAALTEKIEETGGSLDESQLWEFVAAQRSPQWQLAKTRLEDCREDLEERLSDDNIPLGPIGMAFDGGELDSSRDAFALALSGYTIINEDLRQRRELQNAVAQLTRVQKKLKSSYDLSRKAMTSTRKLDQKMKLSSLPSLMPAFRAAKTFRQYLNLPKAQLIDSTKRAMFRKAASRKASGNTLENEKLEKQATAAQQRKKQMHALIMHGFD